MPDSENRPIEQTAAEEQEKPVRTLGDFRLLRKLGQGGMAEVWLAEQVSLGRRVALKLLKQELMQDDKSVSRFQREASAAGGLNHPNIVQVHTVGEEDGQHYIAQEFVQGITLKQHLRKKGPPDLPLALHIMRQVASALKAAADAGIVHRDIKPENIMLTRTMDVKVADFGLAQLYGPEEGVDITQEGMTVGTPLYMSPEQIHGEKVDPRSDLYSFGVTCYHMFTGRPPFEGPTAMAIAVKHVHDEATPLHKLRPDLPKPVCEIVSRMLQKAPKDRYPSAGDLYNDVRRLRKALHGAQSLAEIELTDTTSGPRAGSRTDRLSMRSTIGLLTGVFALAGIASAGVGWLTRPADPLSSPPQQTADTIMQQSSARDQFVHAMVLANNEDAFLAVLKWDPQADGEWIRRAQEQLAVMYIRDRHRWPEAEEMLTTLESYGTVSDRYRAEALIGRAALLAYQGAFQKARTILQSQLADGEGRLPVQSPFRQLLTETQNLCQIGLEVTEEPDSPASAPSGG